MLFQAKTVEEKQYKSLCRVSVFVSKTFNKYYLQIIHITSIINITINKYIRNLLKKTEQNFKNKNFSKQYREFMYTVVLLLMNYARFIRSD